MTRRETVRRLAIEARPFIPRLLLSIGLGTVAGLAALVAPWALSQIMNEVIVPAGAHAAGAAYGKAPNLNTLYLALTATFLSLVIAQVANYGSTYVTAWSGQRLLAGMRQRLFERILALPLAQFDKWRPGEFIARFNSDLQIMGDAVSVSLPQLIQGVLTFTASFAYMVYLDWRLTIALVLVAPVISIAVSKFQHLISSSTTRSQVRIAELSATLTEVLQGQRVVKAFGREEYEARRFKRLIGDYFDAFMKLTQFVQTQPLIVTIILAFAVVGIIWFSAIEVLTGRMNPGSILNYWLLVVNLVNPMNRVAAFVGDLSKAVVATGRIYEIMDLPAEEHDVESARPMPPITGRIAFEHVYFTYEQGETAALRDVDATIEAGEIVALVGPSGAGKTTIVNLVPRFYLPQQGRICIDGTDIAGVRIDDLRRQIAIVPQDPQLFRTSILENIRYGRLEASDEEVQAAAREANADEFVRQFPDGYFTQAGERGVRLSGGERQRIAIARAILRDPRILILDEATSALDSHSEAMIEQALDRLLPGRTTLIIAHRLSTIRRAHKILYIEAGHVLEFGTHEELLAKDGPYARLHNTQFAT